MATIHRLTKIKEGSEESFKLKIIEVDDSILIKRKELALLDNRTRINTKNTTAKNPCYPNKHRKNFRNKFYY